MKSSILSNASRFLIFVFISTFILLMSFSPKRTSNNEPKSLSNSELYKLVGYALKDSAFQLITEADIKRFLDVIKSNKSIDVPQWSELSKKKNVTTQESERIFSLFGFINIEDLTGYADLLASLGIKYGIHKLDESSQRRFFEILRKKQNEYIADSSLLEKAFQKYASPGGMPPECWKCVYDFRDCNAGTLNGNWVISYSTMSTTWTTYDMSNGGISITRFTYNTPSRPIITYVNPQYSTTVCERIYRNCMDSCKY